MKLPAGCVVLLECMSNLVANEMFEEQGAHDRTVSEVTKGIGESAGTGCSCGDSSQMRFFRCGCV